MNIQTLITPSGTPVLFVGPPLEEGPKPTLFYFALSAKDTLQKDPYNQPVQFLEKTPFRIFSITLPGHENNLPPEKALNVWAEKMKQGEEIIPSFIQEVKETIDFFAPYFQSGKLAVAGLSRGAFIACHVAAVCPEISHVLGFAPLTKLSLSKEFQGTGKRFDLDYLVPELYDRNIRFYIGNNDSRVGTEHAFSFIHQLAKTAEKHRLRSPPVELIIGPSIGYQGHGTSPQVFQSGINYLKKQLLP